MTGTEPDFDERAHALGKVAHQVAFRILGDREDARDITQEALARAFARWSRVGPYDEAWITRVATNLALDLARSRARARRRGGSRLASASPASGSLDPAAVVAQRRELVAVLSRLPRRQRQVVALRFLADRPEAEVAAALGCSLGTVKQHASRGLAALRTALDRAPSAATPPAARAPRPAPLDPSPAPAEGAP
jgi:RNA polymerase sigma factor (sigma-70 family)